MAASKSAARGRRAKVTTSDLVAVLRDRIAGQTLLPGSKLREQDLADEFSVPRARIRDVFTELAQRGLIERIPNRGAVVTRLDLDQVFQLYDVREVLEGVCARLATENVPPESWQDLVDHFAGPMVEFVSRGNFDEFIGGYELLRRRTREAAQNPVLGQMLDSIYERTAVVIRRIIILPGRAEVGLAEHRAVLAAMRAGDGAEAERLRRHNMRSAKATLHRYRQYVL
ncbi:MAG TPA: GntR family transcriptional regulator [Hyphomicrobiaceae bacterium]|nr:GntR family transcriptional regulator [Hyphomicrobiaceae bacterium]